MIYRWFSDLNDWKLQVEHNSHNPSYYINSRPYGVRQPRNFGLAETIWKGAASFNDFYAAKDIDEAIAFLTGVSGDNPSKRRFPQLSISIATLIYGDLVFSKIFPQPTCAGWSRWITEARGGSFAQLANLGLLAGGGSPLEVLSAVENLLQALKEQWHPDLDVVTLDAFLTKFSAFCKLK